MPAYGSQLATNALCDGCSRRDREWISWYKAGMPNVSLELFNAGSTQDFDRSSVTLTLDILLVNPQFPGTLQGSAGFAAGGSDTWEFGLPVGNPSFTACFRAVSRGGVVIFNSGDAALPTSANSYPIAFLVKDTEQTVAASQISLPFPMSRGSLTLTSGKITLNNGSLSISGGFTYVFVVDGITVGSFSGTYNYTFTLLPQAICSNPQAVLSVSSISLTLSSNYGWLVNILLGPIFGLISGAVEPMVAGFVQQAVNAMVSSAFGQQSPPAGTTACVTNVAISPAGIALSITASVPASSVCSSNLSSGQ
jgi:hypothetical protein